MDIEHGLVRRELLFPFARRRSGGQPPRRPDSRLSSPQPPDWGKFKITRRKLIIGSIIAGSIALLKPWEWSKQQSVESPQEREVDLGKQRLNEELDKLPDSPIKSLLTARVKPLFGSNPPKSINYDGLEIKLAIPQVVLKTVNTNEVRGLVTPRGSTFTTPEPLYPIRETTIRLPYLGLLLDSEKDDVPAENLAHDGTPLIYIDFPTNRPLYEGLSPVMTMTTPDPSIIKPEYKKLYENFERFAYIKESCALLAIDILIGESVKKMHSLGLSTTIETKRPDGTKKQAEVLTQSFALVSNTQGRFAAAIDLASYLLAFKAFEGTEVDDPNHMDAGLLQARPTMQAVNLGSTPQEVLYNSLNWALTTPEASKLHHGGNIYILP